MFLRTGLLAALFCTIAPAQLAFDSVTIKQSAAPAREFRYTATRITCNQPLLALVEEAWYLKDFQISGPEWLSTDLYDVAATMPAGTPKELARLMLRSALEQRLAVKSHMERRELPVYALTQVAGGSKLQARPDPDQHADKSVPKQQHQAAVSMTGKGLFMADALSMGDVAAELSRHFDKPVLDMTRLNELYDIHLQWYPVLETAAGQTKSNDVELMKALESQIGLKLELRKVPFDILVIDHVEKKPAEN
jgi:uncharacterized protein (TIGR03435 family)